METLKPYKFVTADFFIHMLTSLIHMQLTRQIFPVSTPTFFVSPVSSPRPDRHSAASKGN